MSYLQSSKKQKKPFRFFVLILLIILIFGISFPRKIVLIFFEKTFRSVSEITFIKNISIGFQSKKELVKENEELKKQVGDLNSKLLQSKVYEEEYKNILEEDQYLNNFNGKFTRVISRPPFSPYDTFLIDIGNDQRITDKSLVISYGVPIGYIEEIFGQTARVRLLSSSGIMTVGRLNHQIDIEIFGIGGGRLVAKVPSSFDVSENDIVTLPQFDGLVLTVISSIAADPSASFKDIYMTLPKNLSNIDFVYVDFERKW